MTCKRCGKLEEILRDKELDNQNLELALRTERRKVTELRKELKAQRDDDEQALEADVLFKFWNKTLRAGRCRVMGEKRQKNALARLKEGYTLLELMDAVRGAGVDAFVNEKGKRFDDLELICRDATYVDRFVEAWEREQDCP